MKNGVEYSKDCQSRIVKITNPRWPKNFSQYQVQFLAGGKGGDWYNSRNGPWDYLCNARSEMKRGARCNVKFKFGDRVRVTGILERKCRSKNVRPHGGDLYKYWQAKPIPVKEGILIGYRTLSDGVREWVEGYIFIPKEHYRVALVVFNERQNPVYVLLGDLREPI